MAHIFRNPLRVFPMLTALVMLHCPLKGHTQQIALATVWKGPNELCQTDKVGNHHPQVIMPLMWRSSGEFCWLLEMNVWDDDWQLNPPAADCNVGGLPYFLWVIYMHPYKGQLTPRAEMGIMKSHKWFYTQLDIKSDPHTMYCVVWLCFSSCIVQILQYILRHISPLMDYILI